MIEVKVTTTEDGGQTSLDVHMKGTSYEIGLEMAYIVTKLPERLLEENALAFYIMRNKVKEISEASHERLIDRLRKEMEQEEQYGELN